MRLRELLKQNRMTTESTSDNELLLLLLGAGGKKSLGSANRETVDEIVGRFTAWFRRY